MLKESNLPEIKNTAKAFLHTPIELTDVNPLLMVNHPVFETALCGDKLNGEYSLTDEEYEVYSSLPSTVTVYRGVAVGRNPKGLSWTTNHSTAEWLSNRFNTDTKKGYIQKATVSKSKVFAYFNSRNEGQQPHS